MSFFVCMKIGADAGMPIQFLAIASGMVLVLGPRRRLLIAAVSVAAIALIVAEEITIPPRTGLFSRGAVFASFVACIIGTGLVPQHAVFKVRQARRPPRP